MRQVFVLAYVTDEAVAVGGNAVEGRCRSSTSEEWLRIPSSVGIACRPTLFLSSASSDQHQVLEQSGRPRPRVGRWRGVADVEPSEGLGLP